MPNVISREFWSVVIWNSGSPCKISADSPSTQKKSSLFSVFCTFKYCSNTFNWLLLPVWKIQRYTNHHKPKYTCCFINELFVNLVPALIPNLPTYSVFCVNIKEIKLKSFQIVFSSFGLDSSSSGEVNLFPHVPLHLLKDIKTFQCECVWENEQNKQRAN